MTADGRKSPALRWFGRSADRLRPSEKRVLDSARERMPIARDVNARLDVEASFGNRLADRIAAIGGSWTFICSFLAFLLVWVVTNTVVLARAAFDPYPFIFLNLVLSMIAAIQAPIIMMSQNRSAERDRLDAGHDYEVNLKSEIEIMALHDKLDDILKVELSQMNRAIQMIADRLDRIDARYGGRTDGERP